MAVKTCAECKESKPTTKFFPSVATLDGLKPICTTCYFVRNNGRSPRGFRYVTPPGAIKVWITHGSLWHNFEARITIAEAVPLPHDPTTIELLAPHWDEDGGCYRKPDWHTTEEQAYTEVQRLIDEVVEGYRKEFAAACAARSMLRAGKGFTVSYR
jgi:hypothetical protein